MKISNFLYNEDHAISYCRDTIFSLHNKLYYVINAIDHNNSYTFECRELPIKNSNTVKIDMQSDIDWNPCSIGFINIRIYNKENIYGTVLLIRPPTRLWKLGLPFSNLIVLEITDTKYGIRRSELLYDEIAVNCLNNKFFELDEVKVLLNNKNYILALNKYLIINTDYDIFYYLDPDKKIGKLIEDTIVLQPAFKYLKPNLLNMRLSCKVI